MNPMTAFDHRSPRTCSEPANLKRVATAVWLMAVLLACSILESHCIAGLVAALADGLNQVAVAGYSLRSFVYRFVSLVGMLAVQGIPFGHIP